MDGDPCRTCGGDGRIDNALGGTSARCPSCHGTGRRAELTPGFHDVTKTKPSHHQAPGPVSTGPRVPVTAEAMQLSRDVNASPALNGLPMWQPVNWVTPRAPATPPKPRRRTAAG